MDTSNQPTPNTQGKDDVLQNALHNMGLHSPPKHHHPWSFQPNPFHLQYFLYTTTLQPLCHIRIIQTHHSSKKILTSYAQQQKATKITN